MAPLGSSIRTSFLGRFLERGHARSVKAKKNVLLSILSRAVGMIVGFIYFPISLAYLGQSRFGLFLTLTSMVDWFKDFDAGIGNGLRNKVGEAVADGNDNLAKAYISTAYFYMAGLVIVVMLILMSINLVIPWSDWLNTTAATNREIRILVCLIIIAFAIRFVSTLVYQIFFALQQAGKVDLFKLIGKLVFLGLLLVIVYFSNNSIILFGSVKTLTFALVPLLVGVYFFRKSLHKFRPALQLVRRSLLNNLLSLGLMFFLIKVSMIVIFQTNNLLIAGFVSVGSVAEYQAAYKYFSIFLILFHVITAQLWGANIEAYRKGEISWMRKSMRSVFLIWVASLLVGFLMVLISPFVYKIWLQEKMQISLMLSIVVITSIACTTWVNIFNLVLNGTGKIRLQMYAWLTACVLNIPFSIFFARGLNLGVIGIELGTICSMIPLMIVSPIQVRKILAQRDTGIWSK